MYVQLIVADPDPCLTGLGAIRGGRHLVVDKLVLTIYLDELLVESHPDGVRLQLTALCLGELLNYWAKLKEQLAR